MNEIDVSDVLARMRSLAAQTGSPQGGPAIPDVPGKASFSEVMRSSLDTVNANQQRAAAMAEAFEAGTENVDLADVMISLQKANLSFKAMTEVRNQLVNAYQEIMNMPV